MEKIYKGAEFMEYPEEKKVYSSLVESVPIEVFKQIKGEYDVALEQLKMLDLELFEKPYLKAIPIEWIKDYVNFGVSDELAQRSRRFVLNMIKDWEKENERMDNR